MSSLTYRNPESEVLRKVQFYDYSNLGHFRNVTKRILYLWFTKVKEKD